MICWTLENVITSCFTNYWIIVAVTTAENGQRALEFLGLGDGHHTINNIVSLMHLLFNSWGVDPCRSWGVGPCLEGNELGQLYTKFTIDQCTSWHIIYCVFKWCPHPCHLRTRYLNDHLLKFIIKIKICLTVPWKS